jgi:hypothetical protein
MTAPVPMLKIRGTAQHVAEKYMNLARDAQSSGDRVMAENYLQHAEHYNRIIMTAQAQMQERFQRDDNSTAARDRRTRMMMIAIRMTTTTNAQSQRGRNDAAGAVRTPVTPGPRQERGRTDRSDRPERQAASNGPGRSNQPAYDPDAPQPEIEGVPAEVAIGQESRRGRGRPRPRRRAAPAGRPKRRKQARRRKRNRPC